jgi:hypothetical protein
MAEALAVGSSRPGWNAIDNPVFIRFFEFTGLLYVLSKSRASLPNIIPSIPEKCYSAAALQLLSRSRQEARNLPKSGE